MRPIIQKKQKRSGAKIFFIFALLLVIFFSASPSSFYVVSSFFNRIAVPFWNIEDSATKMLPSGAIFQSKTELKKENADLRGQIVAMKRDLKSYDFVVQENLEFKKLFAGKKDGTLFAGLLGRPRSFPFDTFLLEIGSESGIKNGALVFSDQNIALGKIIETYPYSAKIKTFSSSGETTDAFLGPENIPVQLKGAGAGSFTAELPRDLDVQEGDATFLPGSEGFILAYVESKEENLTDSFQKLYLRGPVNVFELKYVQITSTENL